MEAGEDQPKVLPSLFADLEDDFARLAALPTEPSLNPIFPYTGALQRRHAAIMQMLNADFRDVVARSNQIKDEIFVQMIRKIPLPSGQELLADQAIEVVDKIFSSLQNEFNNQQDEQLTKTFYKIHAVAAVTFISKQLQRRGLTRGLSSSAQFPFFIPLPVDAKRIRIKMVTTNVTAEFVKQNKLGFSQFTNALNGSVKLTKLYDRLKKFLASDNHKDFKSFYEGLIVADSQESYQSLLNAFSQFYTSFAREWIYKPTKRTFADGIDEYTNALGCKFYGNPEQAKPACENDLNQIDEIVRELKDVRYQLSETDFHTSHHALMLIKEAIIFNKAICDDLFNQFSRHRAEYIVYSNNPDIVLHANDGLIPIEQRAQNTLRTVILAFDMALENGSLLKFFEAFLPLGYNTICLESLQQTHDSFMKKEEKKNRALQERAVPIEASHEQITEELFDVIKTFKAKVPHESLGGATYNQYIADGKITKRVLKAEEAMSDQRVIDTIIMNTIIALQSCRLIATNVDVKAVIDKDSLL